MIVVDASALTEALVYGDSRGRRARSVLGRDPDWSGPDHLKVEVFSAVRGLVLGGGIAPPHGARAVERLRRLVLDTVPVDSLLGRMWTLRNAVSAYDAAYVALAEARRIPLVTGDRRLARAALPFCRVELVGADPATTSGDTRS